MGGENIVNINKNQDVSAKESQAIVRIGAALGNLPLEVLDKLADHLEFMATITKAGTEKKAG